jgi:hypothetical protein
MMAFKNEEELELWYSLEKERLSDEFTASLDKDRGNTAKYKLKFNAKMKKLLVRYNSEYERFLEKMKKMTKKQE